MADGRAADGVPAARLSRHVPAGQPGAVVLLLHGAGTDTQVPALLAVADALAARGLLAVRVDQPYTLGPRRPPPPAPQLDAVVVDTASALRAELPGVPLLLLGRSSGGRVACRTAAGLGAVGVVTQGFPLVPPRRARPVSRAPELAAAGVPVLVVQGTRDPFGGPAEIAALALPDVEVHAVQGGDHGLGSAAALADAVAVSTAWLLARAGIAPSGHGVVTA